MNTIIEVRGEFGSSKIFVKVLRYGTFSPAFVLGAVLTVRSDILKNMFDSVFGRNPYLADVKPQTGLEGSIVNATKFRIIATMDFITLTIFTSNYIHIIYFSDRIVLVSKKLIGSKRQVKIVFKDYPSTLLLFVLQKLFKALEVLEKAKTAVYLTMKSPLVKNRKITTRVGNHKIHIQY